MRKVSHAHCASSGRWLAIAAAMAALFGCATTPTRHEVAGNPGSVASILGGLDGAQRARFDTLADELFCPCQGGETQSLSSCLMDAGVCHPAVVAADAIAFQVEQDVPDAVIMDVMTQDLPALTQPRSFDLEDRPRLGAAHATVQLVVFEDFECPACQRMSARLPSVLAEFGDSVSLVFKHFPLPRHAHARRAARAAVAAQRQGRFWEMHDALFAHQRELTPEVIDGLAEGLGLDMARFRADLDSADVEAVVAGDVADGERADLPGTPTLYVNGLDAGSVLSEERLVRRIALELARDGKPTAQQAARLEGVLVAQAGGVPGKGGGEVSADVYPALDDLMELFNGSERSRLVRLAESEICPCDGAVTSLDACLKAEGGTCELAMHVGKVMMRGVKEGDDDGTILDQVVREVEEAKRVHTFELNDVPSKGAAPDKAKLVLVEFADFGCGHCAHASKVVKELAKAHADEVAVYFKQFPIRDTGDSPVAARAALAAHRQGKFWPMHDLLFDSQPAIGRDDLLLYAQQLGLDLDKFKADLDDPTLAKRVEKERAEGVAAGIDGTPAFFIDGVRYLGDFEELESAIRLRLGGK